MHSSKFQELAAENRKKDEKIWEQEGQIQDLQQSVEEKEEELKDLREREERKEKEYEEKEKEIKAEAKKEIGIAFEMNIRP